MVLYVFGGGGGRVKGGEGKERECQVCLVINSVSFQYCQKIYKS